MTIAITDGVAAYTPRPVQREQPRDPTPPCATAGDVIELQVVQTGTTGVSLADLELVLEHVPF